MPEPLIISNTSPLLYLHLIDHLDVLPNIYNTITIPPAVVSELAKGAKQGINVPDPTLLPWLTVKSVQSQVLIPVMTDLGAGEAEYSVN